VSKDIAAYLSKKKEWQRIPKIKEIFNFKGTGIVSRDGVSNETLSG
jgi:hypothetical protein